MSPRAGPSFGNLSHGTSCKPGGLTHGAYGQVRNGCSYFPQPGWRCGGHVLQKHTNRSSCTSCYGWFLVPKMHSVKLLQRPPPPDWPGVGTKRPGLSGLLRRRAAPTSTRPPSGVASPLSPRLGQSEPRPTRRWPQWSPDTPTNCMLLPPSCPLAAGCRMHCFTAENGIALCQPWEYLMLAYHTCA